MSALGYVLAIHQRLYERSDGRIGHRMLGTPTLLLRTQGRRSGVTRTNALVYAADDGGYVVVASKGGDDHPPGWLLNLEAEPNVEVQVGRTRRPASARVLGRDSSMQTTAVATTATRPRRRGRSRSSCSRRAEAPLTARALQLRGVVRR